MPTRWNSTFVMFERVIQVHGSLSYILSLEYPTWPQLHKETVKVLKNANELLEVFKSVREEISSEKMVTWSSDTLNFAWSPGPFYQSSTYGVGIPWRFRDIFFN